MENTLLNTGFSFDLPKGNSSIIKVIGVGGGGNNALKHMYEKGIHGVDFVICNTDSQTLDNNPVSSKVQLGVSITEGLGAGADPDVGEKAAIESIDEIKAALGQNTKMVFITAGMGGGTGTGAAPVIAKVAKEMGILTVGIVTVPFSFEGKRRLDQAELGLDKLRSSVDSLIVINNDKLRQQFGNLGFKQGFAKADEVLYNAAKGMAEVITGYFTINIDFRDAKSVLQNSGTALMSTGTATGENKAEEAVKKALDSPLLNDNKITGAKNVLLLIRSGNEEATMDEVGIINDYIQREAGNTADIIFGVGSDEELGEGISVLVIATGFAKDNQKNTGPTEKIKLKLDDSYEKKESPFKSKFDSAPEEKITLDNNASETRNLFVLDDDAEVIHHKKPLTPSQEQTFKKIENQQANANEHHEVHELDLFSFEDEELDLQAESFSFETEEQAKKTEEETKEIISDEISPVSSFSEEKPIEFSFFINEPVSEPIAEPAKQTFQKLEEPLFVPETQITETAKNETNVFETKNVENNQKQENTAVATFSEHDVELQSNEFTFISKPADSFRIQERRNKLKEFNSRYQVTDQTNDFETVPAFRRKNIVIDGSQASEKRVQSFLTENADGEMKVRENRFLNKDVD